MAVIQGGRLAHNHRQTIRQPSSLTLQAIQWMRMPG